MQDLGSEDNVHSFCSRFDKSPVKAKTGFSLGWGDGLGVEDRSTDKVWHGQDLTKAL